MVSVSVVSVVVHRGMDNGRVSGEGDNNRRVVDGRVHIGGASAAVSGWIIAAVAVVTVVAMVTVTAVKRMAGARVAMADQAQRCPVAASMTDAWLMVAVVGSGGLLGHGQAGDEGGRS